MRQGEFQVVVVPPRTGDVWELTSPYVEMVWSELLGPTATMVARRLGHVVDYYPNGTAIRFDELASSLSVSVSKVTGGLKRLHHHGLISFAPDQRLLGVSGYAPPVGPSRLVNLSQAGRAMHDQQKRARPQRDPEGAGRGQQAVERLAGFRRRPAAFGRAL